MGILVLIFLLVIVLIGIAVILPKFLLTINYHNLQANDIGLKFIGTQDDGTIVFKAGKDLEDLVEQYAITSFNETKSLNCKYASEVTNVSFDVCCFNRKDKNFEVIKVREKNIINGVSRTIKLPKETSYICIVPIMVNDNVKTNKLTKGYSLRSIVLLSIIEFVLLLGISYSTYYIVSYLGGDLFYLEYLFGSYEALMLFLKTFGGISLFTLIMFVYLKFRKIR